MLQSTVIECPYGEGTIGEDLATIQEDHKQTVIGSYPRFDGETYSTQIVIRGRDANAIEAAAVDVHAMLERIPRGQGLKNLTPPPRFRALCRGRARRYRSPGSPAP